MSKISLNDAELATVLHALRKLVDPANCNWCCPHFDDVDPLSDDEIDLLCERLNFTIDSLPKQDWVAVDQDLPPENTSVEVWAKGATYTASHKGFPDKPKFWWIQSLGAAEFADVSHWRYPTPPKVAKEVTT